MAWKHSTTMSVADSGAMVIEGDDGWEAHPQGSHGGACGVFSTREEALTAADWQVAGASCCRDDDA